MAPPALAGSFDLLTRQSGDLPTIESAGERALIERIRRRAGEPPAWITLGIGDDAAVLAPERGRVSVVTTDSLVEDVHFCRAWTSAGAIGHKALAVNLSDLAAMGAEPRAAFLSLAMPANFSLADFDALVDGLVTLGERERCPLAGGNITRSPGPLVVDVTLVGAAHPRRVLRRGGGRPGDEIYLTGAIGAAGAGLARLQAGAAPPAPDEAAADCLHRYERPEPRLTWGVQMGRNQAASAAVDLSDGLADAARQIATASATGIVLDAEAIPVHPGARAWAQLNNLSPLAFALSSGEDYELLFAVPAKRRRAFLAVAARCGPPGVTRVGRLTREPGAWLSRDGRLEPLGEGFTHFRTDVAPHQEDR